MQEKRLHPRKIVELPVTVTFETTQAQALGTCRDISIGGMFVETDVKAAFGTNVSVEMATQDGLMTFPAVVRWTAPTGLGLQFGLVGARETHAIVQLMSSKR